MMLEEDRRVVVTLNFTKIERTFRWLVVLTAVICAILSIIITAKAFQIAYVPFPFMDQWGALSTKDYLTTALQQHNEHRLVLFKLMSAIDNLLSSGTYQTNFIVSGALQFLHAAVLVFIAWWAGLRRPSDVLLASAISFGFLFWGGQSENFFWGFQTQFFSVYFFGTLSFLMLAAFSSWIGVGLATISALLAVGSMANGVIVPALLPFLAVCLRRPWRHVGALALAAGAMIGAYLAGYHSVSYHSDPLSSLGKPMMLFNYVTAYLGNPSMELLHEALRRARSDSLAIGAGTGGVIGVTGAAGWLLLRKGAATPPRLVLLYVTFFIGGSAFVTALGRVDFGLAQAFSSRYLTPALIFWVSLIFLIWSLLSANWRMIVPTLATVSVMLMPTTAVSLNERALEMRASLSNGATAALAQVTDETAMLKVFPDAALVASRLGILKADRLGVFSRPSAEWYGTPLQSHVALLAASDCLGAFDVAMPLPENSPKLAYRVQGWAWDPVTRAAPEQLIFTDEQGRVVGYGLTDTARPDVRSAYPSMRTSLSGWRGHVGLGGAGTITAYALVANGTSACPVGTMTVQ